MWCRRVRTSIVLTALAFAPQLRAQAAAHQQLHSLPGPAPEAVSTEAAHHAFLEQERAAISRGEGFGMALVADHNGYPGPKHVLEMKDKLQITPQQQSAVEKLFVQMKQQAIAKGKEVLGAEALLEQMFASGNTEAELRAQTERVGVLRAELRWVHLSAHLEARKLLTPEQLAAYQRLRHHGGLATAPSSGGL